MPGKYLVSTSGGKLSIEKLTASQKLPNRPFFLSSNHGEFFGMATFAAMQDRIPFGSTLLHFDAHHDLSGIDKQKPVPKTQEEALSIEYPEADFVYPLFSNGVINRFFWVLPIGVTRDNMDEYLYTFGGMPHNIFPVIFNPNDLTSHCNASGTIIVRKNDQPNPMVFLGCLLFSELPELLGKLDPNFTVIDLDSDYFGSRHPSDRPGLAQYFPTDLRNGIWQFFQQFTNNRFSPVAGNLALSPDYFFRNDASIDRFAADFFLALRGSGLFI
ncbi:MAG: hypothetical protein KKF06_05505 [Candidatus Margulisbacteria bacterium]|nr:hypothetical protein [Candidatus Margulisiibacteriota bacterium]